MPVGGLFDDHTGFLCSPKLLEVGNGLFHHLLDGRVKVGVIKKLPAGTVDRASLVGVQNSTIPHYSKVKSLKQNN